VRERDALTTTDANSGKIARGKSGSESERDIYAGICETSEGGGSFGGARRRLRGFAVKATSPSQRCGNQIVNPFDGRPDTNTGATPDCDSVNICYPPLRLREGN